MPLPTTKLEMEELLITACNNLRQNNSGVFLRTRYTRPTEWNISRSLAPEIQTLLGLELVNDVDVSKTINKKTRRPDIIFHVRNVTNKDFLVVEVKHNGKVSAIKKDAEKIRDYFFPLPLQYKFGATINFRTGGNDEIVVYTNPLYTIPQR